MQAQPWRDFPDNPVGYAEQILGVTLTGIQQEIANAVLQPPFRIIVDSAHNVGKTYLAAVLASWWYDSFDPGVVITTAPTERDVVDLLWTEIRLLRQRANGPHLRGLKLPDDLLPSSPEMRSHEEHWAKGYTARKGESFQGRHRPRMLFLFDEAEGVEPPYWIGTKTMFKPGDGHAWLCIGNPTTTTSASFLETQKLLPDGSPAWRTIRMSALDHPNVQAELNGLPAPIPNAMDLGQLDALIADLCEPIPAAQVESEDFEWHPGSGQWWRPGPIAQPRILGLRPSQGTHGVWSAGLWEAVVKKELPIDLGLLPEIGVDCAWKGDDYTTFHIRWGGVSLKHEAYNGWRAPQTAFRLKELCAWAADFANQKRRAASNVALVAAKDIAAKIDDDATGGDVIALSEGYRFIPVGASMQSFWKERYPNKRSELWFTTASRARAGLLSLKLLTRDVIERLRVQALAPTWKPDALGRRVVEKKEETKEKINRSPDDMDAVNLAYCEHTGAVAHWADEVRPRDETMGERLGTLGRGEQRYEQPRIRTLGR